MGRVSFGNQRNNRQENTDVDGLSTIVDTFNNVPKLKDWPAISRGLSCAIIGKQYKYVWHQSGEEELIDLKNDPDELTNLADPAHETICNQMRQDMLRFILTSGSKWPKQVGHA